MGGSSYLATGFRASHCHEEEDEWDEDGRTSGRKKGEEDGAGVDYRQISSPHCHEEGDEGGRASTGKRGEEDGSGVVLLEVIGCCVGLYRVSKLAVLGLPMFLAQPLKGRSKWMKLPAATKWLHLLESW